MTVKQRFLWFEWDEDGATIFFNITKPTEEEIGEHQIVKLNSPLQPVSKKQQLPQQQWETSFKKKPMDELQKIFAHPPDNVTSKTLDDTTHHWLETVAGNRS